MIIYVGRRHLGVPLGKQVVGKLHASLAFLKLCLLYRRHLYCLDLQFFICKQRLWSPSQSKYPVYLIKSLFVVRDFAFWAIWAINFGYILWGQNRLNMGFSNLNVLQKVCLMQDWVFRLESPCLKFKTTQFHSLED